MLLSFPVYILVVVDMSDEDSIELAGAWKQDFANQTTRTRLVSKEVSKGVETTYLEQIPYDGTAIPVLLIGNKYDLVSYYLILTEVCLNGA